jgi:hypothetical protein
MKGLPLPEPFPTTEEVLVMLGTMNGGNWGGRIGTTMTSGAVTLAKADETFAEVALDDVEVVV